MADASPPAFATSTASRQLWASLSSGQQRTIHRLREALHGGSQVELETWHQLGVLAQALSANHKENYGKGTLEGLSELAGRTSQVIGKARKFARLYTRAEATMLEGEVTWEQMLRLVAIPDARIRSRLLKDCRSKRWSIRKLQLEIHNRGGRQRDPGSGGRPSHRPRRTARSLTTSIGC